ARLMQATEEKMRKANKVTQASKRVSKKGVKEKPNKMFMTKSKDTSQKGIERAAKALEERVEQLEVVESPQEGNIIRFHQSKSLQLHNKFPLMADRLMLTAGDQLRLDDARCHLQMRRMIATE